MTKRDFLYWLQGFFEISGKDTLTITHKQVGIIHKHVRLVEQTPGYVAGEFIDSISSTCKLYLKWNLQEGFSVSETLLIREKLNTLFEHVIDVQDAEKYGEEVNSHLDDIHNPQGDVRARC